MVVAAAPVSSRSRLAYAIVVILGLHACTASTSPLPPVPAPGQGRVTFSAHVSRLLQHHCQECHRPGEVAPFSLLSYPDAYSRRNKILSMVQKRAMPPWKAALDHDDFADARRLSPAEIDLVRRWVADGAVEGDPRELPSPRAFPNGWVTGRPGAVFAMPEPFTVPARSNDIYRCFTIPIRLAGQGWRYIRASEVQPGNRKVVHHVQTYIDPTGASVALDAAEPGPGYTCFGGARVDTTGGLGGWAPGLPPMEIPPRVAWGIPPGART
jgi:mono/diheme cytochrome c family protein